jgi:anti-sigma factor RsiW
MNTNRQIDHTMESRLGAQLAVALSGRADALPHDVSERLRFARERALAAARASRVVAEVTVATPVAVITGRDTLAGFVPWWQRAASALPLVLLVLGLMWIDHWSMREQVVAAAEFDAQLLADDLPPAAFSDPGFAEFLRSAPNP